jgi:hypothetical protein
VRAGGAPGRPGGPDRRRVVALGALALAAVLGAVAVRAPRTPAVPRLRKGALASWVAPSHAVSASFYCAGATGGGGVADGLVEAVNAGPRPVAGTLTGVSTRGPGRTIPVVVPAHGRLVLPEAEVATGPFVALTARFAGGDVAVGQTVAGPLGEAAAPCASAPAPRWYFPSGSTSGGARLALALYDPLPTEAVVDLSFATPGGVVEPGDDQGLVVPSGSLVVVDVGLHVPGQHSVAATVSCRQGEIVADALETAPAAGRPPALELVLGAPRAARTWYFPNGDVGSGVEEAYRFYDPTETSARLVVSVELAVGSAAPFELRVPAFGTASLVMDGEPRIPPGVPHAVVVHSSNGVGVVAARWTQLSPPAPTSGRAVLVGSPWLSRRWLFPGASGSGLEQLVVEDPGRAAAHVTVSTLGRGLRRALEVPPGHQAGFLVPAAWAGTALEVEADRPVAVEADLYRLGHPGVATTLALPF